MFEILSSPLTATIDYKRTAALQLVAEIIEEALPEQAVEDAVFRLALAVLEEIQVGRTGLPIAYFCLWMCRLMGWMPELGHCVVCGLDLRGGTVFYTPTSDGVTCADDRRNGAVGLTANAVLDAQRIFRGTVKALAEDDWPAARLGELRRFGVAMLERHLERRLRAAVALGRG